MREELKILNTILKRFNIDKLTRENLLFDIEENFKYYMNKAKETLKLRYKEGEAPENKLIKEEKPEIILKVFLILLPYLKNKYERKDISQDIFYDTISDIFLRLRIYRNTNSELGLTSIDGEWLVRIFYLNIFKLGSLQFEMTKLYLDDNNIRFDENLRDRINYGENVLSVHIMEGEDISPKEVKKSLEFAKVFFKEKFGNFKYRYFYCWSWLLYSGNKELLDGYSNIIKFMNYFEIIAESEDDEMAIERIFGCEKDEIDLDNLKTSLQKNAARNIESLGTGAGIIEKSKI